MKKVIPGNPYVAQAGANVMLTWKPWGIRTSDFVEKGYFIAFWHNVERNRLNYDMESLRIIVKKRVFDGSDR